MSAFTDWLVEAFVPSESINSRFTDMLNFISSRFPFSLSESLTLPDDITGSSSPISSIGWIPLSVPDMSDMFVIIRAAAAVVIWVWMIMFIVDRLTPQAVV